MESCDKVKIYDKGYEWENRQNLGSYESFLTLRHGDIYAPTLTMVEPLLIECEHFVESVKQNKPPLTDGKNGLEVLRVLDAAQKSLDLNGRPVEVFSGYEDEKEELFLT